ncbi:hypothetical protein Nmel_014710 [Mimus melanotis]
MGCSGRLLGPAGGRRASLLLTMILFFTYFFSCLPGPCEPLPPALLLPPPAALPAGPGGEAAGGSGGSGGSGSRRFPQAIIVGVKKGGTRALLEFLRAHPGVRAVGAEPHFFDRCYEKGLRWYR